MDRATFNRWQREYHPCHNGLHVFQPEGGEFGGLTLKNFPGSKPEQIIGLSSAGDGDDFDLIIDVMEDGSLVDTIPIRRQDLAAIERLLEPSNG